ncbi:MAG: hypothetical protein IH602_20810 [Bryobacteraceae bacterium]|nr:hypothetical protein [Bryobacteraceae bacterium]
MLLDHGAEVNVHASNRRLFEEGGQKLWREFRGLTTLSWGDIYPGKILVSQPAMQMIEERGGVR